MVETFHRSSGNVFEDIGFTPAEAAELTAKSMLITAIVETIDKRKLTQRRPRTVAAPTSLRFPKSFVAAWRA